VTGKKLKNYSFPAFVSQPRFLPQEKAPNYFCHRNFNDMKRVAIPVSNDYLSEYFGECQHYEIFEVDGKIVDKKEAAFPGGTTTSELPVWLKEQGITDVIVYKVNRQILNRFAGEKVNLFVGIPQNSPEKLVEAWLEGKLESDEQIISEITNLY